MRAPISLDRIMDFLRRRPVHPDLMGSWGFLSGLEQDKPLEDYEFTVVDTELTGMDTTSDEIVAIGAVRIREMRIDPNETYYTLVHPEKQLPRLSTLVHRITPEEVKKAPSIDSAMSGFLKFAGRSLIIGHHVGMDMTFLSRASRQVFGGRLKNPCLDTMRLAQAYQEELFEGYYDQFNLNISYNLGDLTVQHDLPAFPAHNALADAMQAAYLFLFLARKIRGGNVKTLTDLYGAGSTRRFL